MRHTTKCLARQEKKKVARVSYLFVWPNACTNCGGTGEFFWRGTQYEPPTTDCCELCTCIGRCPRCGYTHVDEDWFLSDERACDKCGWNWGNNTDDFIPPVFDDVCGCGIVD